MSQTSRKPDSASAADFSRGRWWLLVVLTAMVTLLQAGSLSGAAEIRQEQATVAVTYHAGWNLVGVPDGTAIPGTVGGALALIAGSTSYASATADDGLAGGQGYWAYFATETHIDLPSTPLGGLAKISTDGGWTMIGNPSTQPVRLSGADTAYGFDPVQGFGDLDLLAPGRGALVYSSAPTTLILMAAPDTIRSFTPPGAAATPVAGAAAATGPLLANIELLASSFGQARPGAPITVAVLIRNQGAATDLLPTEITIYDATGVVIAAGSDSFHYVRSGETTGFARRLRARGLGTAARVEVQVGDGRPAGDPPAGAFSFGTPRLLSDGRGVQASATITSSYLTDLSEVYVDAVAYDNRGAIIGGGNVIVRLLPAGSSVGVLVPLDISGTPARVDLYAHLP